MAEATKSLAAEIEAVLRKRVSINCGQRRAEPYYSIIGIPEAAAEIAALQGRAFEDGAKVDEEWLTPAQLRYLSRVSIRPAPIGAIGATRVAAEKLLRMGLWTTEQVRSNHRERTYYRITNAGLAALKSACSAALPLQPEGESDA
ncbi:hypothetical protein MEX01_48790 [Methylorubrum extorquens]|uniref:hypothetical protein n=1 Tax=Methylorubrum extorquens TaxID=408 RepID=UPI00117044F0|nr:hypothetical protein [Methylorubrum extorquens]GEL44288.1 hypothetical protein MEX01_48790 [Methylorubrum extorquens]